MKRTSILILFIFILINAFSQFKEKAVNEKSVVWLGIDFTAAKLTLVTEDPNTIVGTYYNSINRLIPTEPAKYDIKKFFSKSEVIFDLDMIIERNSKIDPAGIITYNDYTLYKTEIQKIVGTYDLKGKSGMGLVLIAENLNKSKNMGSYFAVFIDMSSGEIIDVRRISGKAAGIGFRNFWAGSVYNAMKTWLTI
jgi:hypothetical protein